MTFEDTICAPATSPVNSTLAIIRISGPDTLRVVNSVFNRHTYIEPRKAVYGSIFDNARIIDDVILVYYQGPHSFTGEDMTEIFCHGNQLVVRRILSLLLNHGLRMAEPGEFSRRSFINGKIDLTVAEAINQIIQAKGEWQIDAAIDQMHGSLKKSIGLLRDMLTTLKADIEAEIDFSEEGIEFISHDKALLSITLIRDSIKDIYERCMTGEKYSKGIDVILTGRPNVGKSSIMNYLLNEDRSIVSDIPGTTRDLIREEIVIDGMMLNLYDTAGIGEPEDDIERIGIEKTHKKIQSSSIVIIILDGYQGLTPADILILEEINEIRHIVVINKMDIAPPGILEIINEALMKSCIPVSAVEGTGINEIRNSISRMIREETIACRNSYVADLRILDLLKKSIDSISMVENLFREKHPPEIIAFEIHSLIQYMKEITGEISPDDVLDSIFSRFCIGK